MNAAQSMYKPANAVQLTYKPANAVQLTYIPVNAVQSTQSEHYIQQAGGASTTSTGYGDATVGVVVGGGT